MTIAKFLEELSEAPRKGWRVDGLGGIRYKARKTPIWYCPITYVYLRAKKKTATLASTFEACRALGLSEKRRDKIMSAADNDLPTRLRYKLRRAVGLLGKENL